MRGVCSFVLIKGWRPHPWRYLGDVWTWPQGMWCSDGTWWVRLTAGSGDFGGLGYDDFGGLF